MNTTEKLLPENKGINRPAYELTIGTISFVKEDKYSNGDVFRVFEITFKETALKLMYTHYMSDTLPLPGDVVWLSEVKRYGVGLMTATLSNTNTSDMPF